VVIENSEFGESDGFRGGPCSFSIIIFRKNGLRGKIVVFFSVADTIGEFTTTFDTPESGQAGSPVRRKSAVPGGGDEFANSVHCYSRTEIKKALSPTGLTRGKAFTTVWTRHA